MLPDLPDCGNKITKGNGCIIFLKCWETVKFFWFTSIYFIFTAFGKLSGKQLKFSGMRLTKNWLLVFASGNRKEFVV